VTVPQVVALIERDPLVAARLLRAAQSPLYTRSGTPPVQSLQQAALRLGIDALVQLFIEITTAVKVFRAQGYDEPMAELRRHSVATAYVARLVCRETSLYDEYAFMCGLLHDVGMAACMIVLSAERGGKPPAPGSLEVEWPAIVEAHAEASSLLCSRWKLPADVVTIVGAHHTIRVGEHPHPMAAVIAIAEHLAVEMGFGDRTEVGDYGVPALALEVLGLDFGRVAALRDKARMAVPAP
jgi:putative nucleotidyltransferase with HDIG domain